MPETTTQTPPASGSGFTLKLAQPIEKARGHLDEITWRSPLWSDYREFGPIQSVRVDAQGRTLIVRDLIAVESYMRRLLPADFPAALLAQLGMADGRAFEDWIASTFEVAGPDAADTPPETRSGTPSTPSSEPASPLGTFVG